MTRASLRRAQSSRKDDPRDLAASQLQEMLREQGIER